jgi:hypothetical protein
VRREEAAWRREWARSGGTLDAGGGFSPGWALHRLPNALGLHIASNPYDGELVAESDVLRGGDGGFATCGGIGFFLGWLPLATAYFDDDICRRHPEGTISGGHLVARRILWLA